MVYVTDFATTLIDSDATLLDALKSLNQSTLRVCLVTGEDRRLVGIATDGDVRRALLDGADTTTPITDVMNRNFFAMKRGEPTQTIQRELRERNILQVPILDDERRVIALASRFAPLDVQDVTVVIMAGGLGTRLRPLTNDTPKPLLPLAGKPIVERTIEALRDQGFRRFVLTLNYLGEKIEQHFGDGSRLGIQIDYVWETQALGTAGALSLLDREKLGETLLVLNGDVVTDMPFGDLVLNHVDAGSLATMCVSVHANRIDFGVVEFDDHNHLSGVIEKPSVRHYINAGIYCLAKSTLDTIPEGQRFDMPQLFGALNDGSGAVRVYPTDAFWVDVGRPEDYERIQTLYRTAQTLREPELAAASHEPAGTAITFVPRADGAEAMAANALNEPTAPFHHVQANGEGRADIFASDSEELFVIAKIGTNHNGRRDHALRLIDAAASAGANAVSIRLVRPSDGTSDSDERWDPAERGFNVVPFEGTQLSPEDQQAIAERCAKRGLMLFCIPTDVHGAEAVLELGATGFEVSANDLTHHALLRRLATMDRPIILSAGAASLAEIEMAVAAIESAAAEDGPPQIAILHGTPGALSSPEACNLRAMRTIGSAFSQAVIGWADRAEVDAVGFAAVAFDECRIVEKRLTLDRDMVGPGHETAVEPQSFARFVTGVRAVSNALGDGRKRASPIMGSGIAQRTLVAVRDLPVGHRIESGDLAAENADDGLPVTFHDMVLGARLRTSLDKGEPLTLSQLDFSERDGDRHSLHG